MSDPDLSGAILDGRYQVIEPIAEGAMGAVYRGERVGLGRAVAIKLLHEALPDELASRERFEREAKLMARLEHPNCVSVIDFGVHEDKPFLIMELVRGTSLLDLLEREPRLEPPRATEILRQILSGLAHAHELGIVHRDIKPANIMVSEKTGIGLQVRILDFGLARMTETSTKLTTGIVVGTPNYMSPEQCKNGSLDGRSDLYACGVILFEMLTGRKPFVAGDPIQVVRMHMTQPPPRLADVAPGNYGDLEDVVARALVKEPAARFASAQEMSRALDAAAAARKSLGHAVPVVVSSYATGPQVATASGWTLEQAEGVGRQASGVGSEPVPVPVPEMISAPSLSAPDARRLTPDAPLPDARRLTPDASPRLPFTRKQLTIAGSVLGVIILIAIIASTRSSSSTAPSPAGDAAVTSGSGAGSAADPAAKALMDVNDLVTAGERDRALDVVLRARRDNPQNAALAFTAGRLYFSKLYWTDGIKNFRDAIRLDPAYRSDPELIKTALRGFITTPDVERQLEAFLREDIGAPAIPYLEETARDHPNTTIRARAAAELRRLR